MLGKPASFELASASDLDALIRLLSTNNLPVADLLGHVNAFTLAKLGGIIVGSVGLELYGELALVRSLCVSESHRSKGIGSALLSAAAARACAEGVANLYLLTTGAAPYFGRHGFVPVLREHAPQEIRNTVQFRSLCPDTAVCMHKAI
jgi:amino-acid N-acetyltransferase